LVDARSTADNLSKEIEQRTKRVSELVKAIKIYSYMDRFPLQEVDVHEGLESTLTILGHKIRGGVESGKRGGVAYRDLIHYYTTRMPAQEEYKIFYLFHGEYARK
jgi:hypothetical protein